MNYLDNDGYVFHSAFMKHTSPEFFDDIYLAELLHSEDSKKPSPWYRIGLIVLGVGFAVLALLAWTVGR